MSGRLTQLLLLLLLAALLHSAAGVRHGTWISNVPFTRRLDAADVQSVEVSSSDQLVDALRAPTNGSELVIKFTRSIKVDRKSLTAGGGSRTINLFGPRIITMTSVDPDKPQDIDFNGLVNVLHCGTGVRVNFDSIVTRGFASRYSPEATPEQVPTEILGQGAWPSVTADDGAVFGGSDVTVYSLQEDCGSFASSQYAQARTALGEENVQILGPSTLFINGSHNLTLMLRDRRTNQTVGMVQTFITDGFVAICTTDELAPANVIAKEAAQDGNLKWWAWLLIGLAVAAVFSAAATALFVLRRRRTKRKLASLYSSPSDDPATSIAAAKALEAEQHSTVSSGQVSLPGSRGPWLPPSGEASAAEAALIEAWRNQQLASDSSPDEVELGPLIGRGGFGRVHKARWRGSLVAVKIVAHTADGSQIKDIRVFRETLFSTSLLHPNIVVMFKIITLPSTGLPNTPSPQPSTAGSKGTADSKHSDDSLGRRAVQFAAAAARRSSLEIGNRNSPTSRLGPSTNPAVAAAAAVAEAAGNKAPPPSKSTRATAASASSMADADFMRPLSVRVDPAAELQEDDLAASGSDQQMAETWMLLEYCDRGSLDKAVQQGMCNKADGTPDIARIYRNLMDIASGMAYLHDRGILHGDLKLANVLLKSTASDVRGYNCKVADFGTSRLLDGQRTHVSTNSFGTVAYMPPEILTGGGMSKNTDSYSFGIIMWEMITGKVAFQGQHMAHIILQVVHQQKRPDLPDECPAGYAALMMSCWQQDASRRPSFRDILDTLQRHFNSQRPASTAAAPCRPRQNVTYTTVEIAEPVPDSEPAGSSV